MTASKVGVVIGRFQVDDLHEGHLSLLSHVQERHDRFLVLLGVRISPSTQKNPLDFPLRQRMILSVYPTVQVLPVLDASSNEAWSINVDTAIRTAFSGSQSAIIYGGPDNNLDCYSGKHETRTVDTCINTVRATERRDEIAANPLGSSDFRAGVIYALGTGYPRTVISVDIAALWRKIDGQLCVAVGRKSGETQYRLPGGFVSPNDASFATTARRELREETGLWAERVYPISDFTSDDWRSADQDDITHRTFLFYSWIEEMPSQIKAGDDLDEAFWKPLVEVQGDRDFIVPEHWELFEALFAELTLNNINLREE